MPGLDPMERNIVERLGLDYIADELEQVIHGNGLVSLSEYLEVSRSGRKYRLRDVERKTLWKVYEAFKLVCQQRNAQTFEEWRLLALNYLRSSSTYPRFTALFVDEAQDFSKVARQLCLELVKDPRHLLLAADSKLGAVRFKTQIDRKIILTAAKLPCHARDRTSDCSTTYGVARWRGTQWPRWSGIFRSKATVD
jgi:hypothetical protein